MTARGSRTLVRAQMLRGADAGKAARLRVAIKRLTDAFT